MHAAIFDIDGTLLDSFDADAGMFVDAIRSVMGDVRIRASWDLYECVTDTGILAEVARDNALVLDVRAARAIHDGFMARLTRHVESNGPFQEIPGAREYVRALIQRPDMHVAYATGGWRASATLKLTSAGFPLAGVPLASADDHHDRSRIMLHAFAQLPQPVESITYYGDGEWDRAATSSLGWNFVPVGGRLGGILRFDSMEGIIHQTAAREVREYT